MKFSTYFRGRLGRREYILGMLFILLFISVISSFLFIPIFQFFFYYFLPISLFVLPVILLFILLFSVSLSMRRLNDMNISPPLSLALASLTLFFLPLALCFLFKGSVEPNRYGAMPHNFPFSFKRLLLFIFLPTQAVYTTTAPVAPVQKKAIIIVAVLVLLTLLPAIKSLSQLFVVVENELISTFWTEGGFAAILLYIFPIFFWLIAHVLLWMLLMGKLRKYFSQQNNAQ